MRRVENDTLRTFCLEEGEVFHADILGPDGKMSKHTDLVRINVTFEHVGGWDGLGVRDDTYKVLRVSDTGEHRFRVRHVRSRLGSEPYVYDIEPLDWEET